MTTAGRREIGLLACVVALAMGYALWNGYVSDDVDLLVTNGAVHSWSGLWQGFTAPYWPPPSPDGLYRPLMISFFTLEWNLLGGNAAALHAVSLLLNLGAVVAVWGVLRRFVTGTTAVVGAALFAVHPVHTEAVAPVVSQGELVVGALAALLVSTMIDAERGLLPTRVLWIRTLGLLILALGFKEHAVMIPWLLLLVVVVLAPAPGARLRARMPLLLASVGVTALFWALRTSVLGGLEGAAPALGLPATIAGRAGAMLGVIPTWTELLVFPTQLKIDYGPRELPPYSGDVLAPLIGSVIVILWGGGLVMAWRRSRPVALGLLWIPVALFPVSNLILPTGLWLGERTLFLASMGVVLIAALLLERIRMASPVGVFAGAMLLVGAGAVGSWRRMPVWRSQEAHIMAMVRDSPDGYRANLAAGTWAFDSIGDRATAERHLLRALELWPDSPEAYQALGDRYRIDAFCPAAVRLYTEALRRWPARSDIRISAIACLYFTAEWTRAAELARAPGPAEAERSWFLEAAAIADSAAALHLPPAARVPPSAPPTLTSVWRQR